ncbi:hypothetical protein BO78DRAFT_388885 [Aspergillus sclerotiicarbonarius CBS 121057]|uniref:Uncharacterized protein n=1 Tax=Aspergillus sclerotiicarbonarius (strain CBS 121057 / IBT 28362) TaxID=1448318 RepID=A0A319E1T4_ASPSB|nr:hypothetical protein BO78DRAFT_388885 [Aspergillus sclerotiicarbonarius CBS 121057]
MIWSFCPPEPTDIYLATQLSIIKDMLAEDGCLFCLSPSTESLHYAENGFQAIEYILEDGGIRVFLAKPVTDLVKSAGTALGEAIVNEIHKHYGSESYQYVCLDDPHGGTIISLIESEHPILSTSTESELHRIKLMTDNSEKLSCQFPRDYEYIPNDGPVYVSWFVPDDLLNITLRQRQGHEMMQTTL